MDNNYIAPPCIVAYLVNVPCLVRDKLKGLMSIPEGGFIGFDGDKVYARNHLSDWKEMLTERKVLLQWLENGLIQRALSASGPGVEALKKKHTPRKLETLTKAP